MTDEEEQAATVRACVALQTTVCVGRTLAHKRIEAGITVEQAARIIGCSTNDIIDIESEAGLRSLDEIAMFAAMLDLSIAFVGPLTPTRS